MVNRHSWCFAKWHESVRDIAPVKYGPNYSWHDFGRLPFGECPLLDHVFVNKNVKATRYRVIDDKPEKVYLSDHFQYWLI